MTVRDGDYSRVLAGHGDLDFLGSELDRIGSALTRRVNADPENLEKGLAQLVLTLIELLRQLMERQALRRSRAAPCPRTRSSA